MQFLVPKFIEREMTLVGPLTFKQLLWLVGEGIFVFVFYFFLPRTVFWVVVVLALIISAIFVFIKPGGRSLFALVKHLGKFLVAPKRYIWQKKTITPSLEVVIQKKQAPLIKKKRKKLLGIPSSSQLSRLKTKIETKRI